MLKKIKLTYHAIERFFERFPKLVAEKKIVNDIVDMNAHQKSNLWKSGFLPLLENATENRAFLNNSAMMVKLYERYGYDSKLKFLDNVEARARFVLRDSGAERWVLVTIIDMEYNRIRSNIKYNKPQNTLGAAHKREIELKAQKERESRENWKAKNAVAPKRILIWAEGARVLDESGFIINPREQINKLSMRVKCRQIEVAIKESIKQSEYDVMPVDENGFCTVTGVAFGYEMTMRIQRYMSFGKRNHQIQSLYDVC